MKISIQVLAVETANAALEVRSKFRKSVKNIATFATLMGVALIMATTAKATIFNVTNTNDSGAGSLRQAILDANANAGSDAVFFSPNVFNQPQTITLAGDIGITQDLQINGGTANKLTINGGTVTRIFNINNANVEINNLTLTGGRAVAPNNGGAMFIDGGTTTLFNVTVFNNSTTANGGGIYIQAGTLNATNTTFALNTASVSGGAISVNNSGTTVNLANATMAFNSATTSGGGIHVSNGVLTIRNSIFRNTSATGPNILGNVISNGYNLFTDPAGAVISGTTTGNQLNVDPQLGSFTDNGGKAWTFQLTRTSPAVDTGDPSQSALIDQRGSRRNTDGNYDGVAGVDIGSFERQKSAWDVEGDGTADLSVTRAASGNYVWYGGYTQSSGRPESLSPSPNVLSVQTFGLTTDLLAPADYDGDGRMDAAVFRQQTGVWYINRSTAGFTAFQWGVGGDVPVPADYDGDGKADIAVYRGGVWYIFKSRDGYTGTVTLGSGTDRPVPADYDGDLKADVAVRTVTGLWTVNKSSGGVISELFGVIGDIPVPADYDGNGTDNIAVYRPTDGTWYIKKPAGGYDSVPFGLSTDKPVPADYDGDGKIDIAVTRANTQGRMDWFISQSRDGLTIPSFGFLNDSPVANTRLTQ